MLTTTRDLRPRITDTEADYFRDLRRHETSCNKWDGNAKELRYEATKLCDSMSVGAIQNGEVQCLADMPLQKVAVCHKLLGGEGQMLKKLEKRVKESSAVMERLSRTISSTSGTELSPAVDRFSLCVFSIQLGSTIKSILLSFCQNSFPSIHTFENEKGTRADRNKYVE